MLLEGLFQLLRALRLERKDRTSEELVVCLIKSQWHDKLQMSINVFWSNIDRS